MLQLHPLNNSTVAKFVVVNLQGYATVSHFNCVHYECHSAAVK